jgi:hypothetical protein
LDLIAGILRQQIEGMNFAAAGFKADDLAASDALAYPNPAGPGPPVLIELPFSKRSRSKSSAS